MPRPTPPPAPPPDLDHRRLVGAGRVVVALTAIALASVEAIRVPDAAVWVAAIAWLPLATWLWFAEEGPPDRTRARAGMALDVAVVLVAVVVAPDVAPVALLLAIPLAAATSYSTGVVDGLLIIAAVVVGRVVHVVWGGAPAADPVLEVAIGLAAAAVVALMTWAGVVRRRDEARSAALLQTATTIINRSAEAVVITDAEGVVLRANPTADRVLGEAAGTPLTGGTCHDRLALQTAAGRPLDCRTGCALAAMCVDHDGEVELSRDLGGSRQPLLATATPIRDHRGRTVHLHSFRDVTRLKQADEAKTMFLATTSHELKTPLTVIRGFTQLLQRSVQDPDAKVALDAIDTRSVELSAIVDRLLLSSRIEAGRVDLTVEPVDLTALLHRRGPDLAGPEGGRLVVDVEDGLEALASPAALQTVLEQLVGNALKYSTGTVELRAAREGAHAVIDVTDTGIGMTSDEAAQCFERFWQAEASDVRRYGGTGIGLYIVRSLVEAMEGDVEVTSTPGAGSTFRTRLAATDTVDLVDPGHAVGVADASGADQRTAAPVTVDEFMTQLGIAGADDLPAARVGRRT